MFKILISLILVSTIIMQTTLALADSITKTQVFRLSVTLPESAGLPSNMSKTDVTAQFADKTSQRIQEQRITKNDRTVVVRSIVVL